MLPDTLLQKFSDLIGKYPVKRSALIPMLLYSQEEFGYVTDESILHIASALGLPEIDVREVISFYSMLRTRPVGRFHIQVCTNISCLLLNGESILKHISSRLGIQPGESTTDQVFSLAEVECLGACCNAPAMQINRTYYENLTLDKVDQILHQLKSDVVTQ
jgi:NADH-quinone oxidoreductase subunit E